MAEEKDKGKEKEKDKEKEKGKDEDQTLEVKDPNKNKKLILMAAIGGGAILLILIVIIVVLLLRSPSASSEKKDPEKESSAQVESKKEEKPNEGADIIINKNAPPVYLAIEPPFTVNIASGSRLRMMQIKVQLMARNQRILEVATGNMPLIQNALVGLFSSKSYEDLITPEGKEALRVESLKTVQEIIKKEIGQPGIDQVLFTSFVMQ